MRNTIACAFERPRGWIYSHRGPECRERGEIDATSAKLGEGIALAAAQGGDLEAATAMKSKPPAQSRIRRWFGLERRQTMSDVLDEIGPKGKIPRCWEKDCY